MIRTINKLLILAAAALSGAACGEQAGASQEILPSETS